MLKNLTAIAITAFFCAFCVNKLTAQDKKEARKVVIIEKVVDEDGKVSEEVIVKEGSEAQALLKQMESGENMWISENGDTIKLDEATQKMIKKEAYEVEVIDENGQQKTITWDGEGEMPAELKEVMAKGETDPVRSKKSTNKIRIRKKVNGEEKEMEFEYDGETLPAEVKKILEEEGIDPEDLIGIDGGEEIKIIKKKEPSKDSKKAQLGVNIEGHPKGVRVSQVVKNSSADEAGLKAGDIINAINETKVADIQALVATIANFKPLI